MEIMWDIPFYPWTKPNPDIYHVQSCYKPWAKIPTYHKPWPKVRISILALGRKHKKKENPQSKKGRKQKRKENSQLKEGEKAEKEEKEIRSPIKDRKKTKETCRKVFGPNNIWTIQNCHQENKRKKRKPWPKVVFSLWLPTKILCVGDFCTPH